MRRFGSIWCLAVVLSWVTTAGAADHILLTIEDIPDHGLVTVPLDLTAACHWCSAEPADPPGIEAIDAGDGRTIPAQFVPDPDFDPVARVRGTLVMQLPPKHAGTVRLAFRAAPPAPDEEWNGVVKTAHCEVVHRSDRLGGFPSQITFTATGKVFDSLRWHDRVHHRESGGYRLIDDRGATVQRIAHGPLCTVVRVAGHYLRGSEQPQSKPRAVYQWLYFHDRPLVYVTALQRQDEAYAWHEWHFLELIYPDESFVEWMGTEPESHGRSTGSGQSANFSRWAALVDGPNTIGMFQSGRVLIHDGRGAYGTYLHAFGNLAWQGFAGIERRQAAWLWIGCSDAPKKELETADQSVPSAARAQVTVGRVHRQLAAARQDTAAPWQHVAAAEQLETQGRFQDALDAIAGRMPDGWISFAAGDLAATFEPTSDGLRLLQLADLRKRCQLSAGKPKPLFDITLRHGESKEQVHLDAEHGWERVSSELRAGKLTLRWHRPLDEQLTGLNVVVTATPNEQSDAIEWDLTVANPPAPWSVWRVVFPQVALTRVGSQSELFFPRAAGEVTRDAWTQASIHRHLSQRLDEHAPDGNL